MAELRSNLFHAIVGLGLAACGGKTASSAAEGGSTERDAGLRDASAVHDVMVDVAAIVDVVIQPDVALQPGSDAASDAHDAAVEAAQPPPPPDVK